MASAILDQIIDHPTIKRGVREFAVNLRAVIQAQAGSPTGDAPAESEPTSLDDLAHQILSEAQ